MSPYVMRRTPGRSPLLVTDDVGERSAWHLLPRLVEQVSSLWIAERDEGGSSDIRLVT